MGGGGGGVRVRGKGRLKLGKGRIKYKEQSGVILTEPFAGARRRQANSRRAMGSAVVKRILMQPARAAVIRQLFY